MRACESAWAKGGSHTKGLDLSYWNTLWQEHTSTMDAARKVIIRKERFEMSMGHVRRVAVLGALAVCASIGLVGQALAGPVQVSQGYGLTAHLDVDLTAAQCDNTGNTIDIDTTITLVPDVGLTLTFSNKIVNNNGYHPASVTGTGSIVLIPQEGGIHLPKQGVYENGVTGNPYISALIGGQEIFLGRC